MNNEESHYVKCGEIFLANKNDFTFLCYYCNELFYDFIEFRTHSFTHLDSIKSGQIGVDIDEKNDPKLENTPELGDNSIYNEDGENNFNKSVLVDYKSVELENNINVRSEKIVEIDQILNQNIKNIENPEIQNTEEYCSHCKAVCKNESHNLIKCCEIQEKIKQCNGNFLELLRQGILCCNQCQRYFKNYKLLYEHHLNEKHCSNDDLCKICKFYTFMTLRINSCKQKNCNTKKIDDNYRDNDEDNINILNNIDDTKENYKRRIREFRFNCPLCERVFRTNYQKQNHMKIHTNDRPHKCDMCSAAFTLQSYLKTHIINKHTDDRPFSCKYDGCDAKFKLPGFLKQHEKTHLPSNFQCEMCGHYYKTKVYLLKHQLSAHTDSKSWPHRCEICDRRFSQAFRLNEHKRVHTGEKPFPCNICSKFFRKQSNLREHKKLHSEEKKYVCRLCGKGFKQAAGYWGHIKRHPVIS